MNILKIDHQNLHNIHSLIENINNSCNIFVLIHWKECNPCKTILPKWQNIMKHSQIKQLSPNDTVIATVEQGCLTHISHNAFQNIESFPTIVHIKNNIVKPHKINWNDPTNTFMNWILEINNKEPSLKYYPNHHSLLKKKKKKTKRKNRRLHQKSRKNKK